ncbi:serine hydrolase domain-containing protein [Methanoculleus sp. 7T]|uniref:serine hydrolase domain-containing protein n=1 Tax=Methanoculleus sp. 7T TaxID=2937282 RepID=UPI0020C14508|nr:serine hydrolase domain-containing protein [Methanoculleus sp. 7T]MCK8517774.1 beta-lactamase family protein [Methanoculleus sp. 7T]
MPRPLYTKPYILLLIGIAITAAALSFGCMQNAGPMQEAGDLNRSTPPSAIASDLESIVSTGVRNAGVPGTLIEISTPEWTWNYAAGNASLSPAVPATPEMRFIVASVTKTFTSVAIQQLAEDGKLALDDPIDRWLPTDVAEEIPESGMITIRQLLDHTSGIADYDEDAIVLEEYRSPNTPVPYREGMRQGLNAGLLYSPGTSYTYSNVNYILLTLIIDEAAGIPYEDYVTRNILVPAGMNDTFVHRTNHIPGPHMRAQESEADGTIMDFSDLYLQFDRGAGDIVSTTADLNRFHRALRSGELISPASLAAMENTSPQSRKTGEVPGLGEMSVGCGYGYFTQQNASEGLTLYGHTGGYYGSYTILYYWAEKDTYIAMNSNSAAKAGTINEEVLATVLRYLKEGTTAEQ